MNADHIRIKQFTTAGKLYAKVYKVGDVIICKKIYREDGGLSFTVPFKDNRYHGEMLVYYESGKIKRKTMYDNGEIISQIDYDVEGNIVE